MMAFTWDLGSRSAAYIAIANGRGGWFAGGHRCYYSCLVTICRNILLPVPSLSSYETPPTNDERAEPSVSSDRRSIQRIWRDTGLSGRYIASSFGEAEASERPKTEPIYSG